jgi:peptide/nickel transport system permease protein
MIPILFLVSLICFVVIKLQPGEFGSELLNNPRVSPETVFLLRKQLGLDKPAHIQYLTWLKGIITRGDFGYSFIYRRPVTSLIWSRLGWTVAISLSTMLVTWVIAIPIGIYSATHKYSVMDYVVTTFGFIGISVPDFFLALFLMYVALRMGSTSVGGLFSTQYIDAPWSWAKFMDLLRHLWIPLITIGLAGTAGIIRQMRANLLDILGEQYIQTARAKGLSERLVIYKHALRNAINPLISLLGIQFPNLISGTIVASIVLNLPTMGPFFYDALLNHDQYLVMTFLLFSALMMLVGNLLADLALAWADPRIRFE